MAPDYLSWVQRAPSTLGPNELASYLTRRLLFTYGPVAPELAEVVAALRTWPRTGLLRPLRSHLEARLTLHALAARPVTDATTFIPRRYRALLAETPVTLDVSTDDQRPRYGACPDLDEGHHATLFSRGQLRGRTTLITLDNLLIGAVKHIGDPSLLALRNVLDTHGRLVLARGGVYDADISESAAYLTSVYPRLEVRSLTVRPIRFIEPRGSFGRYLRRLTARRTALE